MMEERVRLKPDATHVRLEPDTTVRARSFGVSVGGVLLLIAAWGLWRGGVWAADVTGGVGLVLVLTGLLRPSLLAWPSAIWWRFALALGHVNARVILTVAFFLILTPTGWLRRLLGHDPLGRRRSRWPGWVPYPERHRVRDHYRRMY